MLTVCAVAGRVYVVDAVPSLAVIATGVPKFPPTPPSLKVMLTPGAGLPLFVASTVRAVGRVVPVNPV